MGRKNQNNQQTIVTYDLRTERDRCYPIPAIRGTSFNRSHSNPCLLGASSVKDTEEFFLIRNKLEINVSKSGFQELVSQSIIV